jgi:hypothetical protein
VPRPGNVRSTRAAILCLLNHERARHGLAPLTPDGLDPKSRIAAAGYPLIAATVGENIH